MGLTAAKQCCDHFFCKNKVIPIQTTDVKGDTGINSDKRKPSATGTEDSQVPMLGEVIDYGGQALQRAKQKIAWDDPDGGSVPGLPGKPPPEESATGANASRPAAGSPPSEVWRAEDFETSQAVSTISPSVPWLLPPDSGPDNLQL